MIRATAADAPGSSVRRWWKGAIRRRAAAPGGRALVKSASEIESMRAAGAIVAAALREAAAACVAGTTTRAIDAVVADSLRRLGGASLFPGYRQGQSPPFPASSCVSVNEEVVHGVPGDRIIRAGDVVKIDVGARGPSGWCADAATTVVVPGGSPAREAAAQRLVEATRGALQEAMSLMRPGVRWSEVACAMQRVAEAASLGVVQEYVGHGVGRELHEPPRAPAFWPSGRAGGFEDFELAAGMALAVEPIFTVPPDGAVAARGGRTEVVVLDDGWTVVTKDRSLACHEEHTVAVTSRGGVPLTA